MKGIGALVFAVRRAGGVQRRQHQSRTRRSTRADDTGSEGDDGHERRVREQRRDPASRTRATAPAPAAHDRVDRRCPPTRRALRSSSTIPTRASGTFVHWIVIGSAARGRVDVSVEAPDVHELDNTGGTRGWTRTVPAGGQAASLPLHGVRAALRTCAPANADDVRHARAARRPAAADALNQIAATR